MAKLKEFKMNLQKLRFALEVEKTSSITQAAKKLYMSQPNLSKSLKELESEIGITIFRRTPKGVKPTVEGTEFLAHAKNIIHQVDIMSQIYCSPKIDRFTFKVSVPRTTYLTAAFNDFMKKTKNNSLPLDIHYCETSAEETINNIALGHFDIGIIRFQDMYESYFLNKLKENNLDHETLWAFKMRIIMSKNHPLANSQIISYEQLNPYIEILHGDFQIPDSKEENMENLVNIHSKNKIYVFDRGSQYDFLQQVEGSYKWVSPVTDEELEKYNLVQKTCTFTDISRDLLVYPNKTKLKLHEKEFIKSVKKIIDEQMMIFSEDI